MSDAQQATQLRNNPYKVAIASMVGTAIEFYDYYIYAAAAVLVFNTQFFNKENPNVAIILSLSTLALAFLPVLWVRHYLGILATRLVVKKRWWHHY